MGDGFGREGRREGEGRDVIAAYNQVLGGGAVEGEDRGGVQVCCESVGDLVLIGEIHLVMYLC